MLNKKSRGFTLVELLIVIIIIGILATMAVPQYQKMVEKAKWAGPVQMLGALRNACIMYYSEHGAWLFSDPIAVQSFPVGLAPYIDDPNPLLPYKTNQFRYKFWGGSEASYPGRIFLVELFKDTNGDGSDNYPSATEPHIWILDDGTLSSRVGAPKF